MNNPCWQELLFRFKGSILMMFLSLICGLLSLVINIDVAAAANTKSVATIVQIKGISTIRNSASTESRMAVRRQSLFEGDTIQTGEDAWLTFNFYDLTRVTLRPNTTFVIRGFPETTPVGKINLEISRGGARISAGTIAARDSERFTVLTPDGKLTSGRSEWVVRICDGEECNLQEQDYQRCSDYRSTVKQNRQYVTVYKGMIEAKYCRDQQTVKAGETSVFRAQDNACEVIDEVPCFILFDDKLGKDKLRKFLPKLTPLEGRNRPRQSRPNSREVQPRPRVDRPRRQPRGR